MLRYLSVVIALAGCDAAAADPSKAAAAPRVTKVEVFDTDIVCETLAGVAAPRCTRLDRTHMGPGIRTGKRDPSVTSLVAGKAACTLKLDRLACDGAPAETVHTYGGDAFVYLHGSKLRWFALDVKDRTTTPELHELTVPSGIAQLSIGFRVGCALATDGAVWCWSDPRSPKRATVPRDVVEIHVQDPFSLCARTKAGEVHCTAPWSQKDELTCSKSSIACGTADVTDPVLHAKFDPLVAATRPMTRIATGAAQLVRDEGGPYEICMDYHWHVMPYDMGECTVDAAGAVRCIAACDGAWRAYTVGMPAATAVWGDREHQYGLAADRTLYAWKRTCDASAAASPVAGLPPIAQLAEPLFLRSGPQSWDVARCALTVAGETRCWVTERTGKVLVVDPAKLQRQYQSTQ